MANKQRIEYIDLAKGICISLVLLFHINEFGTTTESALQFFRMPLYYFLSGLFFKTYTGFTDFSIRKINKLIVPFLFFFILAYIAGIACHFLKFYERGITEEPFEWNMIFDIFTRLGIGETIRYNSPIWFLLSLFEVNIIYYLLEKALKKKKSYIILVCFAVGLTSILLSLNGLPYFIDKSLKALPFFAVGTAAKSFLLRDNTGRHHLLSSPMLPLVLFGLLYGCALLPTQIGKSAPVYYIAGFIGIGMILTLSQILKKLFLFSYIGRFSLIVLGLHTFLVGPLRSIYSPCTPGWQYILTFLTIILLMRFLIIPVTIRIFPYFTAQKDLITPPHRQPSSAND